MIHDIDNDRIPINICLYIMVLSTLHIFILKFSDSNLFIVFNYIV